MFEKDFNNEAIPPPPTHQRTRHRRVDECAP